MVLLANPARARFVDRGRAGPTESTAVGADGRLTLSFAGAARLRDAIPPPGYRVGIDPTVAEFIPKAKTVFAKHVVAADQEIRAGDEVLVVAGGDGLLATGMALLSGREMLSFNYGPAVKIREGRESDVSR